MTTEDYSHEYFELLCAAAAAGAIPEAEQGILSEHLESCPSCGVMLQEYQQLATHLRRESEQYSRPTEQVRDGSVDEATARITKDKLLKQTRDLAPPGAFVGEADGGQEKISEFFKGRGPNRIGWRGAIAVALLALAVLVFYYRTPNSQLSESSKLTTVKQDPALEAQVQELKQALASERSERQKTISDLEARSANEVQRLTSERDSMVARLKIEKIGREQLVSQATDLQNRVRLLQSSLDVLQASNLRLESDKKELAQNAANLANQLRDTEADLTATSARNEEIERQQLVQVKYVERQRKLLATDRDLRDILGARFLRIIDVYDVGAKGEMELPFGRIFYTEGKSLIFYAFDLDKQKGLRNGTTFQAWGQRGEEKDTPHSLGAFYMDDPAQNRWVLKVDDTKLLSRIDYVFVTDNSHKDGIKPKGKPLLSAFLDSKVNHP